MRSNHSWTVKPYVRVIIPAMFQQFYPTAYYDSAYDIDFEELYRKGFRGLLTDVDNTLEEHGAPSDKRSETLFGRLHAMGWKTCILSNNDEGRVSPFAENTQSLYVCNAGKPSSAGFVKGMDLMKTDRKSTLLLGDQLFTDIWGANRAGLCSILVNPIARDPLFRIRLKRAGEAVVKVFYRRYAAKHKNNGQIL